MAVKVVIAADKQELLDRIKVLIQQVADNLPPEQSFIKVGLSGKRVQLPSVSAKLRDESNISALRMEYQLNYVLCGLCFVLRW